MEQAKIEITLDEYRDLIIHKIRNENALDYIRTENSPSIELVNYFLGGER